MLCVEVYDESTIAMNRRIFALPGVDGQAAVKVVQFQQAAASNTLIAFGTSQK